MVNVGDICPVCNKGKLIADKESTSLRCYNCGYWVRIEKPMGYVAGERRDLTTSLLPPSSDSLNAPSSKCEICASMEKERERQKNLGRNEQVIELDRLISLHLEIFHKEKKEST